MIHTNRYFHHCQAPVHHHHHHQDCSVHHFSLKSFWVSKSEAAKFFIVIINNHMSNMIMNTWQAEGLTAIECWVIACIIFVFGALLEYTVILLKLKLKKVI